MASSHRIGLLIVGHGTRVETGQSQFLALAERIQGRFRGVPVAAGFLELAQPDIHHAVAELAEQGCQAILIVPILLFEAGHAKTDIPDLVVQACQERGMRILGQTPSLGNSDQVAAVSHRRFSELVEQLSMVPHGLKESGYCLVGRGTSDPNAIAEFHRFAQQRRSQIPCRWLGLGFLAAASPTFDDLLCSLQNFDGSSVFMQPHLLFEGRLTVQIRERVARVSELCKLTIHVIPPLGCGEDVVDLFVNVICGTIAKQKSTV